LPRDYSKYINRPGYQVPAGYDQSKFPSQSVTTDVAILSFFANQLNVLLVRRKRMPFQGYWALPGGFVESDEDLPESAARELFEETGLKDIRLIEYGAFGQPGRDPRTRTITVCYLALVRKEKLRPVAGDDAADVAWFRARKAPELAFDHELELKGALERLKELVILTPALFDLLPEEFSGAGLSKLCSEIFGKQFPQAQLLEKMKNLGLVKPRGKNQYCFTPKNFRAGGLGFLIAKPK
jgi:8-oxo-dGTP diphosphatase